MATPFLAEIRVVSFNFPPRGWAFCDGQLLAINQNQSLFSLLGTTYGGDGETNFALPDLRGRVPVHVGLDVSLGQRGGAERHSLSSTEMPTHTHTPRASSAPASGRDPTNQVLGQALNLYRAPDGLVDSRPGTVANVGSGQAHENMQPYLSLNFVVALQGVFPSPT
ncbi:MAG: tail fiber protein [Lysobacterales bacterium]